MRKLFKGGNYSRAETIRGNTVCNFVDQGIKFNVKNKIVQEEVLISGSHATS